jgi:hypothetical protein
VDELEEEIKKNDDFLHEELSKLQKKRVAIQENVEKEESMCLLSFSLMYLSKNVDSYPIHSHTYR